MPVHDVITPFQLGTEQETRLSAYVRGVFINEAPLFTRLPREQAEAESYSIVTYDVRSRTLTLNAALTTGATTITLTDSTALQVNDVIEITPTAGGATEYALVTAVPSSTTATIRRAVGGTTAVANDTTNATTRPITIIGNASTGGEVDRVATRSDRVLIPQYVQTFMYAVQIGGKSDAIRNVRLPAGITSVMSLEQATKLTEMTRDVEFTAYYGRPQAPGSTATAMMGGLRHLIGWYNGTAAPAANSNVNIRTGAGASYTLLNFTNDAIQRAINGGGNPDVLLCSNDFMTGLMTWGFGKQQLTQPRANSVGVQINEVAYPFGSRVLTVIPSYQLRSGTAVVLTSDDLKWKYLREEMYQARGIRGDAKEGDFLGDFAIELGHPGWHAWVEGITSFA
ncbi:MAG: DUF5309 domain-containing protein [Thermoleophilia bacterium]|nr:DUF5309 domain-containing protein [Thermoleophilia bacterium]